MKKEKIERIQRISEWMRYIILALLLAFFFIGYSSAQNTDDFGMWMSAGTEKKINDRWNIGAGIELRTKDNSGSVDRWQLAINGVYKKTLNVTLASLIMVWILHQQRLSKFSSRYPEFYTIPSFF